jgi:hypothetical protein
MNLRPFPLLWLPILLLSPAAAGRYEPAKTSLGKRETLEAVPVEKKR